MPSTQTPHAPDTVPAAPIEEMSGSGTPLRRVPLDEGLLARVRAAAKTTAPASEVVQASAPPIAKTNDATTTPPATPTTTRPDPAPAGDPKKPAEAGTSIPKQPEPKGGADAAPPKKDGIAAVREALERAEARVRDVETTLGTTSKEKADAYSKLAEAEKKAQSWEERFAKEFKPQLERLSTKEKELEAATEQLRIRDYTATPEWHERYVKPIVEVQQEAASVLAELAVADEAGNARAATLQDFNQIHSAPSLNAAEGIARKLFGDGFATTELVRHSSRLRSLVRTQGEALKKAQVESADFFKRQQDEHLSAQARFKQRVQERVSQYVVKPAEGDPEEVAAAARGSEWAEQVEKGSTDPEAWSDMVARVKATVASDSLKDLRLKRLTTEVEGLKAELGRYQRNEPEVATSGHGAPAGEDGGERTDPYAEGSPEVRSHLLSRFRSVARGRG